jgi:hypothetical protein
MPKSKREILTERIMILQQTVADLSDKCEQCRLEILEHKKENDQLKDYIDSILATHYSQPRYRISLFVPAIKTFLADAGFHFRDSSL